MGTRFIRNNIVVGGFAPIDINATATSTDYVALENANHVFVLIYTGIVAATASSAVTLSQASDAAGTGAKTLAFSKYFSKLAHPGTAVAAWSETACSSTFNIVAANDNIMFGIEVDATTVDIANGFKFVCANLASPGAVSCLVSSVIILSETRFATQPMPSGIA